MTDNKPIYVFGIILIAIVSIAISVVAFQYNKNKPIVPSKDITVVSSNDMLKVKTAYETEGKKQEFLELCSKIELAVANKLLDGTVTNDQELETTINKINNMFLTDDWSYIAIEANNYWMGNWKLDAKGALTFSFQNENIKPNWTQDEEIIKYVK